MRQKIWVISITLLLISLLGLIRVVSAREPELTTGVDALGTPNDTVVDTQAREQRRHVLGDGVADTPLEVDALYLGHEAVGASQVDD